jgi:multimeric flavodoxin WrbA
MAKKLLIVYYSGTGNTEAMARAIHEGALAAGAVAVLKTAVETTPSNLLDCDAVIFGTPTYFGYMAGPVKELFDQSWNILKDKVANKPYCAFTSAQSGKNDALTSIDGICDTFNRRTQFKFVKAFEGVVATAKPSPEVLEECQRLGRKMASL